ncbi:MAG TPA: nucleoside kinase, partial [Clostridia bacterium]
MTDTREIKVTFPDGSTVVTPFGTNLTELCERYKDNYKSMIVAAKVDNDTKELTYALNSDCRIEFLDMTHEDGMRIYRRSLYFILVKAVHDLFPDRKVIISHSISKGVYCEIIGETELTSSETDMIEKKMRELVDACLPFVKRITSVDDAKEFFEKIGRTDRYHAIEHRNKSYATLYNCGGFDDYFYGYMVPDTGYIKLFELKFYSPGLIIRFPEKTNPDIIPEFKEQRKLFNIFTEFKKWNKILGVDNVGAVNDIIKEGKVND